MTSTDAARLARLTLGHVGREYPHALVHVMDGPEDVTPSRLHPIFHGSFDWHSCVHGWWQLLRLARLFPGIEPAPEIRERAAVLFTPENVAGEIAYLERHSSFERPYGWAWLLALHREAQLFEAPWAETLRPVAELLASRLDEYLGRLTYPVRSGAHANTAFALILAYEWASANDPPLVETIEGRARGFFIGDQGAHAWAEPSGEDFLSPTLVEALLMVRTMIPERFSAWFEGFLPELPRSLLTPAHVSSRTDGRIGHLDGLNLSRAWCWRGLAERLPPYRALAMDAAEVHLEAALPHLADDYAGEHWLATFALLALSA